MEGATFAFSFTVAFKESTMMLCKQVSQVVKQHVGSGEHFVGQIDRFTRFWACKSDAEQVALALRALGVRFSLRSAGAGWEKGAGVSMWDVQPLSKPVKPVKKTARRKPRRKPAKKAATVAAPVMAPVVVKEDKRPAWMRNNAQRGGLKLKMG
jgi:hypothetical protein